MDMVEFLVVADRFEIKTRGVVVMPHLSPPKSGRWEARQENVLIVMPDGRHLEAIATLQLEHFYISDVSVPVRSVAARDLLPRHNFARGPHRQQNHGVQVFESRIRC